MNFVFDIDGTLCFDGQHIDNRIISRLKQLQSYGHQVIFASARPMRDLLPVIPDFQNNTLIGGNGSIISTDNKIKVIDYINQDDFELIKELIVNYNLSYIVDDAWDYAANVNANNTIYTRLDPHKLAELRQLDEITHPIKVIFLNIKSHHFSEIAQHLMQHQTTLELINHSNESNIDITAHGINKYKTLQSILKNDAPYIAFGNDHNDIGLLQHATNGVLVSNNTFYIDDLNNQPHISVINADINAICNQIDKYIATN